MEPDPEEQEHHADLRQLLGQFGVGDESGCCRSNQDPGE
jgi:hypothetical protein